MADTRTPAERAYDALKDGSAYVKPEATSSPWEGVIDIITSRPDTKPEMPANASPLLKSLVAWVEEETSPAILVEILEQIEARYTIHKED